MNPATVSSARPFVSRVSLVLALAIMVPLAPGAKASGIVIFTTTPADYPHAVEFTSLTKANVAFSEAIQTSEKKLEIPNDGIITVIDSPPGKADAGSLVAAAMALQQIDSALKRYPRSQFPQIALRLEPLAARWKAAEIAARGARPSASNAGQGRPLPQDWR